MVPAGGAGVDLAVQRAAIEANDRQYDHVVARISDAAGGCLEGSASDCSGSRSRPAKGARVLVVLTEWPEFGRLDRDQLAAVAEGDVVVDTRSVLDPSALRGTGLRFVRLGHTAGR